MSVDFRTSSSRALRDPELRANFRRAMDGLIGKRAVQFADADEWTALRAAGAEARARALEKLPELLEQLESRCRANGIKVHHAATCEDANREVLRILERHGAKHVVKGKSMVSEEMHLNDFLDSHGIESLESDLGEYIIQLDHETPSHIIMPAIHKNRKQIARMFGEKIRGAKYTEDVDELTAIARRVLRKKFEDADAGISGVNFAIAETGTLVLLENEGNGRMSTHVPPVHIALMGIEKVLEKLEDLPPLLKLLTRSATGQPISTYVNMITRPRAPEEKDGPREVHVVILDNGRWNIYADPELRTTLRCIRCGACMNHCPVYTRVGGHAYNAVYPGPIGSILTPQIEGLAKRHELPHASSLCSACVEVCPVQIPIATLLVRLRKDETRTAARNPVEAFAWRVWRRVFASPRLYGIATRFARTFGRLVPMKPWTNVRTRPRFARTTLHELARKEGIRDV